MRLPTVERGDGLKPKFIFTMIRLFSGMRAPDVVRTLQHRPEFFGALFSQACQNTLRGPSEWHLGERELVAAFVSKLNQCRF